MSLPVLHPVLGMEEEQGIPDRTPDDHSPDRHEEPVHRTGLREPLEELSHPSLGCQKQRHENQHQDAHAGSALGDLLLIDARVMSQMAFLVCIRFVLGQAYSMLLTAADDESVFVVADNPCCTFHICQSRAMGASHIRNRHPNQAQQQNK
jgi:hypothetical protein